MHIAQSNQNTIESVSVTFVYAAKRAKQVFLAFSVCDLLQ